VRALILAAGRGTRLGGDPDRPKCLVEVGGHALLDRYLDALDELHVPVTVVVGHAAPAVRAHVATRAVTPSLVMNDRFLDGSVVSLAVGLASLDSSADVLLLDGDVAFTPSMLSSLHRSPSENALLVDVGTVFTDEQYMAGIATNRVVALRRGPADGHDTQGEWVGFAKLGANAAIALRKSVDAQIARGDSAGGYEDALARLLADFEFRCVPTEGAAWTEIDFPADLVRARALFQ
jgi:choline kinase